MSLIFRDIDHIILFILKERLAFAVAIYGHADF